MFALRCAGGIGLVGEPPEPRSLVHCKKPEQNIRRDGDINLAFLTELAFYLDVRAQNGSITSDFSSIPVTEDASTGLSQTRGNVGNPGKPPRLIFRLTTRNGSARPPQG